MTLRKGDYSMPMLEVKIRKFQLFFQEMAHSVRYILQVNFSLQEEALVNPFKSGVVVI